MICDGYSTWHEIDGDYCLVRPFPRREREAIGKALAQLPDRLAERAEMELVASRVTHHEWEADIRDLPAGTYQLLWRLAFGIGNEQQEIDDEANLDAWVYLHTRWPWLANTTCRQCKAWWWNPITGEQHKTRNADGELVPLRRPDGDPLPCECGKCPKGHWTKPVELTATQKMAWDFYETHKASGCPDDPICRWYWGVIDAAGERARADQRADAAAARRGAAAHVTRAAGGQRGPEHRAGTARHADQRIA